MPSRIKTSAYLALVLCLGTVAHLAAMQGPYVIDGPDAKIHFRWALQFAAALSEGTLYPRWASYSYLGLGDPTFLYIHPLFYYATAAIKTFVSNFWHAVLGVAAVSSAASTLITFWFVRKRSSDGVAIVAAGTIALSPYCFHLAHYQQFLPMHFAVPALIVFIGATASDDSPYRVPTIAASLAFLTMSHVLAAFMALICTSVVVLLRAIRQPSKAVLEFVQHGVGVFLGLALSAIYLLPALTSQNLISPAGWYEPVYLDWHNAFLFQFLTLPSFGFRWFHLQWTIPLLTLLACLAAGYFLWITRVTADGSWWRAAEVLGVATIALVLGSEISYPLWEYSSILRRLQFPLRFLEIASIASVFSLAWSGSIAMQKAKGQVWAVLTMFIAGSAVMLAALEHNFLSEAKPALSVAAPANSLPGQPEMKPASAGTGWLHFVKQGGWRTECAKLNVDCSEVVRKTHDRTWTIDTREPTWVRLPLLWFPGWQFVVNDKVVTPKVDSETGLPIIEARAGKTTIRATWVGIFQERLGTAASLAALLAIAGWFSVCRRPIRPGARNAK